MLKTKIRSLLGTLQSNPEILKSVCLRPSFSTKYNVPDRVQRDLDVQVRTYGVYHTAVLRMQIVSKLIQRRWNLADGSQVLELGAEKSLSSSFGRSMYIGLIE